MSRWDGTARVSSHITVAVPEGRQSETAAAGSSPAHADESDLVRILESPEETSTFSEESLRRAQKIREASRQAALLTTEAEYQGLLAAHSALMATKYTGGLSTKQERRLALLRWQLDRVEDARYGDALDRLEGYVEEHERLSRRIQSAAEAIENAARGRRKRRRK